MRKKRVNKFKAFWSKDSALFQYTISIVVVGITALLCIPVSNAQGYHVVSFVMLFVVSILATFMGVGPILLTSTMCALIWNFFFIPPHYTFHIDKTEDILLFFMFFFIALINGTFTSRLRRQERITRDREALTNSLYQLTKELSGAMGVNEVKYVAEQSVAKHFNIKAFLLLRNDNGVLEKNENVDEGFKLTSKEFKIANWAFENSLLAGKFTSSFSNSKYTYYPLVGARLVLGVIVVVQDEPFDDGQTTVFNTFISQISNSLEREFLGELAQNARFLDESDKLYKTLFSSISHELRIPVATIMGASDTVLTVPAGSKIQAELINEISIASLRLNRLIENLLNMSRLESGRISPRLDWYDVNDLINKVADELKDELKPFRFNVSIQPDIPLVKFDFGLMEQVLYNLILNSCQHSPLKSNIRLSVLYNEECLTIEVFDRGSGFPEESIPNLFNKFYRVKGSKTGGLGLGLSIVKGFVDAHKGTVKVENRRNGGAKFTISIPTPNAKIDEIN